MKGIQNKYKDTQRREILSDETNYEFDTQLTSRNIQREREFKLEVLKWLTNGEPKLFRSPGEGNYIVRLMNLLFETLNVFSTFLEPTPLSHPKPKSLDVAKQY